MKIKSSIVGYSGYTGLELIRLLSIHPNVDILYLFSHNNELENKYNHLNEFKSWEMCNDLEKIAQESDVIFLALPHGVAKKYINILTESRAKVIDISSDFRIKDENLYKMYYGDYPGSDIINRFQYGLIENNINLIKSAKYISNPGCFATCIQLTLMPFIEHINRVNIFAMTGSSGGGKAPSENNHHSTRSKNIFSYNPCKHRHNAEVYQTFPNFNDDNFAFIPSSGPFSRGIFLNAFIELDKNINGEEILNKSYKNDMFCRIQNNIQLTNVVGSNYFDISILHQNNNKLIVQSVIDNLIKGASGNAIQCMNIMFDIDQRAGLGNILPFYI
jgi:N-acetyl-gamma-glutamyl-phosphate reductase